MAGRETKRRQCGCAAAELHDGTGGDAAVQFAYAWGLATIEAIAASSGISDVVRILEHIAVGEKPEAAVHAILNRDYNDLMQLTADYLRKTYVR